jgi:hypothetical protein
MSDSEPQDHSGILRAYAVLGLCATQFSALEFHIQFLLSFLHMGKELSVETVIFTRRANFSQKIDLIEELLRFRLHKNPDLLDRGLALTKDLHSYRRKRNLFIHGNWIVNQFTVLKGVLPVSDPSWNYKKEDASYKSNTTTEFPIPELELLPAKIGEMIERGHALLSQIQEYLNTLKP